MKRVAIIAASLLAIASAHAGTRLFMHHIPTAPDLISSQPNGVAQAQADPNNCGAQILLPWSNVETAPGVYDWRGLEAYLASWAAVGKVVGVTLTSVAAAVQQQTGPTNYDTPDYVLNSGAPVLQCYQEIGGGKASPPTPDYLDNRYIWPWKAFIAAFVARYGNDPRIAFIDIGIGANESFPEADSSLDPNCGSQMTAMGINATTWLAHAIDMVDFVGNLHPSVQVYWDLNHLGSLDTGPSSFINAVGAEAAVFGMGVGRDNFGFAGMPIDGIYSAFSPLIYAESASVANQGPLSAFPTIMSSAVTAGIPLMHLYGAEWAFAYNPKNPNYPAYHVSYQQAFQSVSPVQGPACRTQFGQP